MTGPGVVGDAATPAIWGAHGTLVALDIARTAEQTNEQKEHT
jgi:hypothetical protein